MDYPIKKNPFCVKNHFLNLVIRLESNRANGQIASLFMLK